MKTEKKTEKEKMILLDSVRLNDGAHGLPKNPRFIRDERFKKLCDSLRDFPEAMPVRGIVVDERGVILGGNMRWRACKELGMKEIPASWVQKLTGLTIEQKRRFIIMDNRPYGEDDFDALANEWDITELIEAGFDEKDLEGILQDEPQDVEPQIDRAAELNKVWKIKTGDLWQIGEHRLLCGDSTKTENVARVMGGEKAQIMFTDPPYNVAYEGNYIQSGKILGKDEKIWNGSSFKDSINNFSDWLREAFLVQDGALFDGAAIYVWHPSGAEGRHFWSAWLWESWHFQVDLIWNKQSLIIARWDYKSQHEPVFYGWKGKNRSWVGANNEPTVLDFPRQQGASGEERFHPISKPIVLCAKMMGNHTAAITFDPFLGSGTTMVACQNLNRRCYGIEILPEYCAVILQRMSDAFPGIKIEKMK